MVHNEEVRKVTVRVPATTANLGPGYDVFGLALNIWNELSVERSDTFSFDVEGEGANSLPRDGTNLVIRGLEKAYSICQKPVPVLSYKCKNRIPAARGLGSSSAAIVSGILAGLALEKHTVDWNTATDLLNMATDLEGHPDNVSPCISGGLQMGYKHNDAWASSRVSVPHGLLMIVFIPEHETATKEARGVLGDTVKRKEAIFNCARTALFVNAFQTGNMSLLGAATQDMLHQPQRSVLHTHMQPLVDAAIGAGAHGAFLSGAGPSIMAICSGQDGDVICQTSDARCEKRVALAMLEKAREIGCPGRIIITSPSERGAYVVPDLSDNCNPFAKEEGAYNGGKLCVTYE